MPSYAADYDRRSEPNAVRSGKPTIKPKFQPTKHKDGTVSYWSVYQQVWIRTYVSLIPDQELAAMGDDGRREIGYVHSENPR